MSRYVLDMREGLFSFLVNKDLSHGLAQFPWKIDQAEILDTSIYDNVMVHREDQYVHAEAMFPVSINILNMKKDLSGFMGTIYSLLFANINQACIPSQ